MNDKCYNCGRSLEDDDETMTTEHGTLCYRCAQSYEEYLDDNADNLAAQERYENFLREY